tara:strand:+ start:81 stop:773 length:693 start_codon:yes stop_codon:yes gene_type:complete
MKNISDIIFKSEPKTTPFAPEWDYRIIEGEIDDVDFDYISNYLLKKKDDILKIKPTHDGSTGLGMKSITARHSDFNIFNFKDNEIDKLKLSIIFLHNELLKIIGMEHTIPHELYIQCWYNVMNKGQKILPHLHDIGPNCYLGGHITIQCNDTYTGYIFPLHMNLKKPYAYESKNEVGKITLFPNYIPHFTNSHNGDKERVTIAFDIITKEQYNHVKFNNSNNINNYVRIL